MNGFLYGVWGNICTIFKGKNLVCQVVMIALTAILVFSGFDWWYYTAKRNSILQIIGFSAAAVGFLVPVLVPVWMYIQSAYTKNTRLRYAASAMVQAGALGLLISSTYKVFTGRVGLPHGITNLLVDTSHVFRFGVYRGGAFQGWPSSHTSVAFAMSMAITAMYPDSKWIRYVAIAYAIYIGIGVSTTIHWFSDVAAGVILGTIIGIAVGKKFLKQYLGKKGTI